MRCHSIPAVFSEFSLPACAAMDATVVIPTVKSRWYMKYGEHAYYLMDFKTLKGLRVVVNHLDVIRPGWNRLKRAAKRQGKYVSAFRPLTLRYHYRFNLLEQVMLMTVPHTVTSIGHGQFVINLWSWCGFLVVDTVARTVMYHTMDDVDDHSVLGSQQWFDGQTKDLYAMSYSLEDSVGRIDNPSQPVAFRIFKHRLGEDGARTVWRGQLSDYMHDILVSESRQYCVACELGMYLDEEKEIMPSKVMVIDLQHRREWVLDRFIVAAHAFFDPDDPNIVYFSNHNFEFTHSSIFKLLKRGAYSVRFRGPASVYKYRLTPEGPREVGMFTQEDFLRLTNMHVFKHRGRRIIAAMGCPDVVFLIDADDMRFIRKIRVSDPVSLKRLYSKKLASIGTIAPSPDGEKLFVQTTGSFQIIDLDTGNQDYVRDYFFNHVCFNHMLSCRDTLRPLTGESAS